ncbi:MAG: glycine--tRNA ligase [Candidatus Woesearchaeota archaeon]
MTLTIDQMAAFCKRKGFAYPSSEIYGGLRGFFDYGPLGVELRNNIKREWWKFFIQQRDDIVGIDGSLVSNAAIWKASGHVDNFEDILIQDTKTGERFRADHFIEDQLQISGDGLTVEQIESLIQEHKLKSPKGNELSKPIRFNLMFQTYVGPAISEETKTYLRPETAQIIFAQFKNIVETNRLKLPFGIAQIGKSFRNEISPRNFLFRLRELEQAEVEFFIHPDEFEQCPYISTMAQESVSLYTKTHQADETDAANTTIQEALAQKQITNQWHAYFIALCQKWLLTMGIDKENIRFRQHLDTERSHYSTDCWDLEYKYPFGFKELWGIADRGTYDLDAHTKQSGKSHAIFDEKTQKKIIPKVMEPSLGIDRVFLTILFDAYTFDKTRENVVLKLHPRLAPVFVAVMPLVKKDGLSELAKDISTTLKKEFMTYYDESGSIGRRYARQDEQGTPFCVAIDYDTKKDNCVTVRDRDSTKQERIAIDKLAPYLREKYYA